MKYFKKMLSISCAALCPLQQSQAQNTVLTLTLQDAIELAAKSSPHAKFNSNTYRIGHEQFKVQTGLLYPQISIDGNFPGYANNITPVVQPDGTIRFVEVTQGFSNVGLNINQPLTITGGRLSVSSTLSRFDRFNANHFTNWQTQPLLISLNQPIFRFNESKFQWRLAKQVNQLSSKVYAENQELLNLKIARAFYNTLQAREYYKQIDYNSKISDTLARLIANKIQSGKIGEEEGLQIQLQGITARNNLNKALVEVRFSEAELKNLIGIDESISVELVPESNIPQIDFQITEAVAMALNNGTDMTRWDIEKRKMQAELQKSQLNRLPGLNLNASYGLNQSSPDLRNAYADPLKQQMVTIGFSIPLMLSGAGIAAVKIANYQLENQRLQQQISQRQLEQDLAQMLLQLRANMENVQYSYEAIAIADKRYTISLNKYKSGKIAYNELLIAQTEQNQAQLNYVIGLQNFWISYYTVRKVTLYDFEKKQRLYDN